MVYYMLNGELIGRSIGEHPGTFSDAQLANQQRTAVVSRFLHPIKALISLSYKSMEFNYKSYAYNKASSYNKINATQGEYPNISMDFSKVRIADGDLPEARNPEAMVVEGGLKFTWSFDDAADWARQEDQVMLMAYIPKHETAVYIYSGARRNVGEAVLAINPSFLGEEVETYIAFVSDDRTRISRSVYTGKIVYGTSSSLQGSLSSLQGGTPKQSNPRNKIASQARKDDKQATSDGKQVCDDNDLNTSGSSSSAPPS